MTSRRPHALAATVRITARVVIAAAALSLSWWSLYALARDFGLPVPLAAVVSLVFDAAALATGDLVYRYAVTPDSSAGPRLAMLSLLAGSVYLNWEHARRMGLGLSGGVMLATPPVVAVVLLELENGYRSREARRARGRMAEALPVVGRWGWAFHPARALVTLWRISAARLDTTRSTGLEAARHAGAGTARGTVTEPQPAPRRTPAAPAPKTIGTGTDPAPATPAPGQDREVAPARGTVRRELAPAGTGARDTDAGATVTSMAPLSDDEVRAILSRYRDEHGGLPARRQAMTMCSMGTGRAERLLAEMRAAS